MQARSSTASTRRSTGTPCLPPRGTAPRAWRRFLPSLLPPCLQDPHLTLPILQPQPSPKLQPRLPALWMRARVSVLLRRAPRPPPQTAPLVRLPASAGEPGSWGGGLEHYGNGVPYNAYRSSVPWHRAADQPNDGQWAGMCPAEAVGRGVGLQSRPLVLQSQGPPWVGVQTTT